MKVKPADPDAAVVPVAPIVIEFQDLDLKRKFVRFNSKEPGAPMSSFYITKEGWGELGQPEGVRLTIEPLT